MKVDDVVSCIFEVECSVGGFLILKQIIVSFGLPFYIPEFHSNVKNVFFLFTQLIYFFLFNRI
jgi:hypothetical protein